MDGRAIRLASRIDEFVEKYESPINNVLKALREYIEPELNDEMEIETGGSKIREQTDEDIIQEWIGNQEVESGEEEEF